MGINQKLKIKNPSLQRQLPGDVIFEGWVAEDVEAAVDSLVEQRVGFVMRDEIRGAMNTGSL